MPSLDGQITDRRIILPVAVILHDQKKGVQQELARALLDTGASASGVSSRLVAALNLQVYARKPLFVATEQRMVNYYAFQFGLFPTNPDGVADQLPYVFGEVAGFEINASDSFDVILGMDILSQCDFTMQRDGSWSLSFG